MPTCAKTSPEVACPCSKALADVCIVSLSLASSVVPGSGLPTVMECDRVSNHHALRTERRVITCHKNLVNIPKPEFPTK